MMRSIDRTALVTGASRGIGAAIAKRLAADGFRIVVNYASSASEADSVVAAIEAAGGHARALQADVASPASVRRLFDEGEATFGPIDVLINNAGLSRPALLADVADEDYERVLAVNLTGSFNGMREAAKRLRDGGRIVNFSSSMVGYYAPRNGVYAATRAAVEAMSGTLAKELGARGITVNVVAPGPTATEMFLTGRPPDVVQRMTADIPLGRLGEPDDVAGVVSFLAGPDGRWVNGQVIKVNGGRN